MTRRDVFEISVACTLRSVFVARSSIAILLRVPSGLLSVSLFQLFYPGDREASGFHNARSTRSLSSWQAMCRIYPDAQKAILLRISDVQESAELPLVTAPVNLRGIDESS
jgi:hypothetical protein